MKGASMSLGIYFEIKDAELYGGEGTTGYAATIVEISIEGLQNADLEKYANSQLEAMASMAKVPKEKVRIISKVETLCRMVDEGYDFTLIAEKLNRTALATRGKYERLQNPEYNKRYNRGQNEDYEYQGIRSISGKDILKDRELMDGAEFQELEPVANK